MKFYYGWVIVGIASIVMMLAIGSTVSVFGLYVLPVSEEYGLSRASVNSAFVVANIVGAVSAPVIGRLADTYSVRLIMTIGAACYAAGFILIGLIHNIWANLALLSVAATMSMGAIGSFGAMTLVARWFEAQRARAMALAVVGMSLGSVVIAPLVGWLIASVGWRQTLLIQGIVVGAIFLLLIAFLRDRPGEHDIEPQPRQDTEASQLAHPRGAQAVPLTTSQLLHLPIFWLVAIAMALSMGPSQAVALSLVPMVQEAGISVTASAGLLSVIGVTGLVGKFALAVFGDKVDKALVLAIMLFLLAAIVAALPLPTGYAAVAVLVALLGLVSGAMMPLYMAILADAVGSASFASANGMASLMIAIGGAFDMRGSGDLYDLTGGYQILFLSLAASLVVAAILMLAFSRTMRGRVASASA